MDLLSQVGDPFYHDVYDAVSFFHRALDKEKGLEPDEGFEFLVQGRLQYDVHQTLFVFEGEKGEALCGGRHLETDAVAPDPYLRARVKFREVGAFYGPQIIESFPEEGEEVSRCGEALDGIIGDQLLPGRHLVKGYLLLRL